MNPDVYAYVLVASIAGGCLGPLVMWNRKRSQVVGASRLRGWIVSIAGTAASACALVAFTKAFGGYAPMYAATVMILVTGWAAVLHSALHFPMPRSVLSVRPAEVCLLRVPWTGVRLFGVLLQHTPPALGRSRLPLGGRA